MNKIITAPHSDLRSGAEKLDEAAALASYWMDGGRKAENSGEAFLCAENSANVWKNAAYAMAEQVAKHEALIGSPETEDFLKGVRLEAAHQVQRWGEAHDRSKSAENWFWLVGYLAGKALRAAITGDPDKARHHTISAAAALFNWHKAISRDRTGAGVGQDEDIAPPRLGAEKAPA